MQTLSRENRLKFRTFSSSKSNSPALHLENIKKSPKATYRHYVKYDKTNPMYCAFTTRTLGLTKRSETFDGLNRFPIFHYPRRSIAFENNYLPPNLELKKRQIVIGNYLNLVNKERRLKTANILDARQKHVEPTTEKKDSFNERYSMKKHKFTHVLLGDVQLPRTYYDISNEDFDEPMISRCATEPVPLLEPQSSLRSPKLEKLLETSKSDLRAKALTCLKHLNQLKLSYYEFISLDKLVPKSANYPKSGEFIMLCKLGLDEEVKKFLVANRWLAHAFDTAGQTGLHWAAKRNYVSIMNLLIDYGAFVDAKDHSGITPLYIAIKNDHLEAAQLLIVRQANLLIKTKAGSTYDSITASKAMKNVILRAKMKYYSKPFKLSKNHN